RVLFHPLVALDAPRVVVLRLALLPGELDAVHAAVALVDHLHVIDDAAAEAGAAGSVGSDPVEVRGDELLLLCDRAGAETGRDDAECRHDPCGAFHYRPPPKSLFQKAERQYSARLSFPRKRQPLKVALMGERPQAQLLLGDLPEAREAVGFDDQ